MASVMAIYQNNNLKYFSLIKPFRAEVSYFTQYEPWFENSYSYADIYSQQPFYPLQRDLPILNRFGFKLGVIEENIRIVLPSINNNNNSTRAVVAVARCFQNNFMLVPGEPLYQKINNTMKIVNLVTFFSIFKGNKYNATSTFGLNFTVSLNNIEQNYNMVDYLSRT